MTSSNVWLHKSEKEKKKKKKKKWSYIKRLALDGWGWKVEKYGSLSFYTYNLFLKEKKKKSGCKERLGSVKEIREWKTWSKRRKEIQENNIKVELKNVKIINRLKVKLENILRIWLEIIIHLGFLC